MYGYKFSFEWSYTLCPKDLGVKYKFLLLSKEPIISLWFDLWWKVYLGDDFLVSEWVFGYFD